MLLEIKKKKNTSGMQGNGDDRPQTLLRSYTNFMSAFHYFIMGGYNLIDYCFKSNLF